MGFLKDKRVLITGLASERSIAWGVAQAMKREGAEIALTYQNDKLRSRVEKLAGQLDTTITLPCDVSNDREILELKNSLLSHWSNVDIIIHAIAYAPRNELNGLYLDAVTREGFLTAHEISSYSFAALAKEFRDMICKPHGSMLTLTYIGSIRSMPGYNVMGLAKASLEANVRYLAQSFGSDGIRVNGISAGPIKTLAASGIRGFKKMMSFYENSTPLGRGVTIEEVGNAASFLCSDLASGITGEIMYVDAGFHSVGISPYYSNEN
ncbi:MAG: enoyl-[acyl-carrier-protein] reductase FabI [Acidiferrobacteraceae bacterium]|nr:enoyl-[acyl-carrier-protein] reductase FabI [Acidiferrobacteraceae bacterium]|tara:strand:- start:12 stop:809 length:798 start_codon:yes stop_codon:yes gene_type:complete